MRGDVEGGESALKNSSFIITTFWECNAYYSGCRFMEQYPHRSYTGVGRTSIAKSWNDSCVISPKNPNANSRDSSITWTSHNSKWCQGSMDGKGISPSWTTSAKSVPFDKTLIQVFMKHLLLLLLIPIRIQLRLWILHLLIILLYLYEPSSVFMWIATTSARDIPQYLGVKWRSLISSKEYINRYGSKSQEPVEDRNQHLDTEWPAKRFCNIITKFLICCSSRDIFSLFGRIQWFVNYAS